MNYEATRHLKLLVSIVYYWANYLIRLFDCMSTTGGSGCPADHYWRLCWGNYQYPAARGLNHELRSYKTFGAIGIYHTPLGKLLNAFVWLRKPYWWI